MKTSDKTRPQSIPKAPTGIEGFDDITGGGLPKGRTSLLVGEPGTGKTVFALQTLVHGATQYHEPGILIAFEEHPDQIKANAASMGWDLQELQRRNKLVVLNAQLSPDLTKAGRFDIQGLLAGAAAQAKRMGAKRVAFDGLDVLLTMLDNRLAERAEICRLREWLGKTGLTGIITAKTLGRGRAFPDHYGFLQFVADCVVGFERRLVEGVVLRHVVVTKYRGSGYCESDFPLALTSAGINIQGRTTLSAGTFPVFDQARRLSSGIVRLDAMLGGGHIRGSSILVTGAPGTAKSTLGGSFALSGCRKGERVLYCCFDETGSEFLRNLRSVNIDLRKYVASGRLVIASFQAELKGAYEHVLEIDRLMKSLKPRSLVMDPISGLVKSGGQAVALNSAFRVLRLAKQQGVTTLMTSLIGSGGLEMEASSIHVSTIADTWIHLSYLVQGGERNRALTIVKARGTKHSNQVRELILSSKGVTLSDVYLSQGDVLMGTARWQKETEERNARREATMQMQLKRCNLQFAEADAKARIRALKRKLEMDRAALALLDLRSKSSAQQRQQEIAEMKRLRESDENGRWAIPGGEHS